MCASPLLRSSLLALTLSEVQRIYFFEICLSLSRTPAPLPDDSPQDEQYSSSFVPCSVPPSLRPLEEQW